MRYVTALFIPLFLFLNLLQSHAQTGCVIVYGTNSTDNKVYTKSLGTTTNACGGSMEIFDANVYTVTAGCFSPDPAPAPGTFRNCIVVDQATGLCGVKTTAVACPIDNEVWILILCSLGLVGYHFRFRLKHALLAIE